MSAVAAGDQANMEGRVAGEDGRLLAAMSGGRAAREGSDDGQKEGVRLFCRTNRERGGEEPSEGGCRGRGGTEAGFYRCGNGWSLPVATAFAYLAWHTTV